MNMDDSGCMALIDIVHSEYRCAKKPPWDQNGSFRRCGTTFACHGLEFSGKASIRLARKGGASDSLTSMIK
jgi:hypothetical protein